MTLQHTILIWILSALFLATALYSVIKGKLRVRYTLLWFGLGVMAFLSPAFYAFCLYLHTAWSFPSPSVLLLIGGVTILALICLQLTASASRAWRERKNLAQRYALLEQRLEVLEHMRKSDPGDAS